MPGTKLDVAVLQATLEALRLHKTETAAARALGIHRATFQGRILSAKRWQAEQGTTTPDVVVRPLNSFDDAWQQWQKAIGMARDTFVAPKPRKIGTRQRVVAAGDFHVPFHDRDAVAELIAREAGQTDILAIGGDFGDAYAASTFAKNKSVPFKEELAETQACMEALASAFSSIRYLRGSNHMDRVEKRLRENNDAQLMDAILYMTGGELSPDLAMVKRYPNVTIDCWETPAGDRVPWLMVIGDVAFSHAEKYSRVPGSALRSVEEWLDDFSGALGLPEIRAVVQFHTHAQSLFPFRADKVLIEPGCMALTQSYQLGSRLGGRPQRLGYVVFEIEDGRIDYDSIRLRWLNRSKKEVA